MSLRRLYPVVLAVLWAPAFGQVEEYQPLRYPPTLAGINPGNTPAVDAVKMYGKGYFQPKKWTSGSRYYTDPGKKVTLHTVIGEDAIVEIEVQRGLHLPNTSAKAVRQAISRKLKPSVLPANLTPKAVLDRYGKPFSDKKNGHRRTIVYKADYRHTIGVVDYEARFTFEDGKLIGMRLSDGETGVGA
ncbi:MAG TPA: hypothetical protein VG820_06015 [Fimbriimonadaceae bacterium]|nr:hypothetical protein [Fimbriimonadaceae bacterium]